MDLQCQYIMYWKLQRGHINKLSALDPLYCPAKCILKPLHSSSFQRLPSHLRKIQDDQDKSDTFSNIILDIWALQPAYLAKSALDPNAKSALDPNASLRVTSVKYTTQFTFLQDNATGPATLAFLLRLIQHGSYKAKSNTLLILDRFFSSQLIAVHLYSTECFVEICQLAANLAIDYHNMKVRFACCLSLLHSWDHQGTWIIPQKCESHLLSVLGILL